MRAREGREVERVREREEKRQREDVRREKEKKREKERRERRRERRKLAREEKEIQCVRERPTPARQTRIWESEAVNMSGPLHASAERELPCATKVPTASKVAAS